MRPRTILTWLLVICGFAGEAKAQERQWTLDAADEDAFLVFGVPETDDVGVSFWCRIGSGRVKLFVPDGSPELRPGVQAEFSLRMDDKSYRLTGPTSANEMSGATSIESELAVDDEAIVALRAADRFTVIVARHKTTFPMHDADFGALLRLCRAHQRAVPSVGIN